MEASCIHRLHRFSWLTCRDLSMLAAYKYPSSLTMHIHFDDKVLQISQMNISNGTIDAIPPSSLAPYTCCIHYLYKFKIGSINLWIFADSSRHNGCYLFLSICFDAWSQKKTNEREEIDGDAILIEYNVIVHIECSYSMKPKVNAGFRLYR